MPKKNHPLFWRIIPSYIILAGVIIAALSWLGVRQVRVFYLEQAIQQQQEQAIVFRQLLQQMDRTAVVDDVCKIMTQQSKTRLTLIAQDGFVQCDSYLNTAILENHRTRPEVEQALQGKIGVATRYSTSVAQDMLYVAVPITAPIAFEHVAVLRVAIPMTEITAALNTIRWRIWLSGGAVFALAVMVSFVVSQRVSKPMTAIKHAAEQMASGQWHQTLPNPEDIPITELAAMIAALKQLTKTLEEEITDATQYGRTLEIILNNMNEGFIALDSKAYIVKMNQAAYKILALEPAFVLGRHLREVIHHPNLQNFVYRAMATREAIEEELTIVNAQDQEEKNLRIRAAAMQEDDVEQFIGTLIVFDDLSQVRKLEAVRRDFVANVSHELKTPITSIKGYSEVLLDGALDDKKNARHFIEIIAKQADRLNAIIEDLLSLARIERVEEAGQTIEFKQTVLAELLQGTLLHCRRALMTKNIVVETRCPKEIEIKANPGLLSQAITNLLFNAIKYSEPGGKIELQASVKQDGHLVEIAVKDNGIGISAEHLPRLFERFYRVDNSRSREYGGTGLGLAIVKHITQVHGGQVRVVSKLGQGSTFFLELPIS